MELKTILEHPVSEFTSQKLLVIDEEETASAAAKKMTQNEVGALVVSRDGEPVGMVTERDILNKVVAAGKDPTKVKVASIMSSPVRSIAHDATVADAIALMVRSRMRRLGVTKNGKLIGVITQRSVVSGGPAQQVALPELESANRLRCPYCLEEVKDQKELSRHIDLQHIGTGLLQGDARKM